MSASGAARMEVIYGRVERFWWEWRLCDVHCKSRKGTLGMMGAPGTQALLGREREREREREKIDNNVPFLRQEEDVNGVKSLRM